MAMPADFLNTQWSWKQETWQQWQHFAIKNTANKNCTKNDLSTNNVLIQRKIKYDNYTERPG